MRVLQKRKDGGEQSTVDAYFLIEIKSLFSIAILKFNKGSRANYHSHAFTAWTWFLKGSMTEKFLITPSKEYKRTLLPKVTHKNNIHKVVAKTTSWCFTIRGPWEKNWLEYDPTTNQEITLTNGRKVVYTRNYNELNNH